jgi:DNA-binding IclR family transcriptional regulator
MSESNQSVERAARILKTLSERDGPKGLTGIARQVGLGKSTTHRILSSLCGVGLARVDPVTRQYSLGYGLLQMTAGWLNGVEVRTAAIPVLRTLRQKTGETVSLNVRDADQRVPLERLDTAREIRYVVDLGRPQPLHVGAGGKAILAFLPEKEIGELLEGTDLGATRIKRLMKELAEIRRAGSSITKGEQVPGACSISAPVFNHQGEAVASLSILCLESTLQAKTEMEFGRLVRDAAAKVSQELSGSE